MSSSKTGEDFKPWEWRALYRLPAYPPTEEEILAIIKRNPVMYSMMGFLFAMGAGSLSEIQRAKEDMESEFAHAPADQTPGDYMKWLVRNGLAVSGEAVSTPISKPNGENFQTRLRLTTQGLVALSAARHGRLEDQAAKSADEP